MLSRVANNFYWMGRYVERVKCLSRLLLIQMNEMPEDSLDFVSISWQMIFDSLKIPKYQKDNLFNSKEQKTDIVSDDFLLADAYTLVDYLTFETYHPNSVLSGLKFARENARQNQGKISRMLWPHINKNYLRVKEISLKDLWPNKIIDLYKDILEFSYLFHGLTRDSLYQDEAVHFIHIGEYVERFQNTASLFESHIRLMMSHKEEEEDLIGLLLRCGAFDNYRQVHSLDLKFRKVMEFLLYNPCFSGSLQFCNREIKKSLSLIEAQGTNNMAVYKSLEQVEQHLNSKRSRPLVAYLNFLYQESVKMSEAVVQSYLNYKSFDVFSSHEQ